jgi:hypothetical protein
VSMPRPLLRNGDHKVKVKAKVTRILRPTVSRPVRLGVRQPTGTRDQFVFLLAISLRQLQVSYFVASSLTRGRVCSLLLLLVFDRAVPLGSESLGTRNHILLSQFLRLLLSGGPGSLIYIPQVQSDPDIPPGNVFPFYRLLRLTGPLWRYFIPPSHGKRS